MVANGAVQNPCQRTHALTALFGTCDMFRLQNSHGVLEEQWTTESSWPAPGCRIED